MFCILSPVYADENCPDDLYYPDSDQNACIHKSEGFLDEDDECVYNFEAVEQELCTDYDPSIYNEEVSQSENDLPNSNLLTGDEQALENLSNSTLPSELSDNIELEPQNPLSQFIGTVLTLLGFNLNKPAVFIPRSDLQHQAQFPPEVKPSTNPNPYDRANNNLSKDVGVYSIDSPEELKKELKSTREAEDLFNCMNFPCDAGINPFH